MPISIQVFEATTISAPTVAMLITALRIFERTRTHKFGNDDALALLSAIMLLTFVILMMIYLNDSAHLSTTTAISSYYVLNELFYSILWCTRLSMLFLILRITLWLVARRVIYGLAAAFIICWGVLFAQNFWTCQSELSWKDVPAPQCPLGSKVAIAQVISDIFADAALIAVPTKLLWNLKALKDHRVRLLLTFSTSIITTAVSLVHAYYLLRIGGRDEVGMGIVEISVSLIVCNIPVIVPAAMRLTGLGGEDDSSTHRENYTLSAIDFAMGPNTAV